MSTKFWHMKPICILGEGAWGTAIATLLANNGIPVKLWCYDKDVCESIIKNNTNKFLPGIKLSPLIKPTILLEEAINDADWIFEAIPVKFLRSMIQNCKQFVNKDQKWLILSKGIEQKTLYFPAQIIDNVLEYKSQKAILSGPTFAHELASQKVTAAIIATDLILFNELESLLLNNYFKIFFSGDLIGVQICSALKNVIALAIGILNGAGYGENTKAFIFTGGLCEIVKISEKLDGKLETVYGLSGIGDLVLTALSNKSKNYHVGEQIGQGLNLQSILDKTGYTPEGINTVIAVNQLAQQKNMNLPICRAVYDILYNHQSPDHLVNCKFESL